MLKPKLANSSQNPYPIPSVAPVTIAQEFLPYRYNSLGIGLIWW